MLPAGVRNLQIRASRIPPQRLRLVGGVSTLAGLGLAATGSAVGLLLAGPLAYGGLLLAFTSHDRSLEAEHTSRFIAPCIPKLDAILSHRARSRPVPGTCSGRFRGFDAEITCDADRYTVRLILERTLGQLGWAVTSDGSGWVVHAPSSILKRRLEQARVAELVAKGPSPVAFARRGSSPVVRFWVGHECGVEGHEAITFLEYALRPHRHLCRRITAQHLAAQLELLVMLADLNRSVNINLRPDQAAVGVPGWVGRVDVMMKVALVLGVCVVAALVALDMLPLGQG